MLFLVFWDSGIIATRQNLDALRSYLGYFTVLLQIKFHSLLLSKEINLTFIRGSDCLIRVSQSFTTRHLLKVSTGTMA